jgi:hypothetical protein
MSGSGYPWTRVVHNHHLDGDTFRARDLCSEAEVEPVTRIVLDHQQGSAFAGNGFDCSDN